MLRKPKLHADLILTTCSSRMTTTLLNLTPILFKAAVVVQEVEVAEEVAEVEELDKEEPSEVESKSAHVTTGKDRITSTITLGTE